MGPNYHVIIDDYHDVEDLMLDLIQSFDAREEVPFTFQADSFTVVHEVDQKLREISIQLASLMEQVTIFNKYVSDTDLYTVAFGDGSENVNLKVIVKQGDVYMMDGASTRSRTSDASSRRPASRCH